MNTVWSAVYKKQISLMSLKVLYWKLLIFVLSIWDKEQEKKGLLNWQTAAVLSRDALINQPVDVSAPISLTLL